MNPFSWQQSQWQSLTQRITAGNLAHAFLLIGPQGIGKLAFALAFTQRLFCSNVQNNQACGSCTNCHLLNVETHPDLKLVSVLEKKQNILVDQIREIVEYVNLKPHSAPKKVVIIDQAETMNINASNSLLKTLEEPPASSILLLVTHRPDRLLPTIRSRCQSLPFATPTREEAIAWLGAQVKQPEKAPHLLAMAGGAPLRALQYDAQDLLQDREEIFNDLKDLTNGIKNPLEVSERWLKKDFELTLQCMTSWTVDMIRFGAMENPPYIGNPDIASSLASLGNAKKLSHLLEFYQSLHRMNEWKKFNINPQLMLESMLIDWKSLNEQG